MGFIAFRCWWHAEPLRWLSYRGDSLLILQFIELEEGTGRLLDNCSYRICHTGGHFGPRLLHQHQYQFLLFEKKNKINTNHSSRIDYWLRSHPWLRSSRPGCIAAEEGSFAAACHRPLLDLWNGAPAVRRDYLPIKKVIEFLLMNAKKKRTG